MSLHSNILVASFRMSNAYFLYEITISALDCVILFLIVLPKSDGSGVVLSI